MQKTTFNSSCQQNDDAIFDSIHVWLGAIYSSASSKNRLLNFNLLNLSKITSVKNIQSNINYEFSDKAHLINAFTQSTFYYEFKSLNNKSIQSNERLEFLGDSLVNFIIAKKLFKLYPDSNEGNLSKLRGALVNEQALSRLAHSISLGDNLLLGKGEFQNQGKLKDSLLADAFEALIAAIYIDSLENIEILESVISHIISKYESNTGVSFFAMENLETFDSKTKLQEISMSLFSILPTYKFLEIEGGFQVELWIGERLLATGTGASKKKCEKELARIVLDEKRYQL